MHTCTPAHLPSIGKTNMQSSQFEVRTCHCKFKCSQKQIEKEKEEEEQTSYIGTGQTLQLTLSEVIRRRRSDDVWDSNAWAWDNDCDGHKSQHLMKNAWTLICFMAC